MLVNIQAIAMPVAMKLLVYLIAGNMAELMVASLIFVSGSHPFIFPIKNNKLSFFMADFIKDLCWSCNDICAVLRIEATF